MPVSLYAKTRGLFFLLVLFLAVGCGGGGGDPAPTDTGGTTGGSTGNKTIISGKVSLSSSLASKAQATAQKMAGYASVPRGKPGNKAYLKTRATQAPSSNSIVFKAGDVVSNATVWLYDSNHPNWIYPVAEGPTDSLGNYTLSEMTNDDKNLDDSGNKVYTNGDEIPAGNYTLLAFTPGGFDPISGSTTEPVVAIQTIVNNFDGSVSGADLIAQKNEVSPKVESMFGVFKNTDGTQTWGSDALEISSNAAVQVGFSMAMARGSIASGVSISPAIAGEWTISPDWLSATFYPDSGALSEGTVYTVTVNGSDTSSTTVSNVYGKALKQTATGTFIVKSGLADTAKPTAIISSPESNADIDIITPVRITSNEILDVNNLLLESTPSLGAKPGVLYIGEDGGTDQYKYVYEFLLAKPLSAATTYTLTVSGGSDLAGNVMSSLNYDFTTKAAGDIAGIDPDADSATQDVQGDVRDVFGRWVRAFNDHNLTQLQNLMVADFVFEYDIAADGVEREDLNRDGRYDLTEFSDLIRNAFTFWEFCGTTITGDVIGEINVTQVLDGADFEFLLGGASDNSSQECSDAAPQDSLYATLTNNNGVWLITRISEGIDTRTQPLDSHGVMSTRLQEQGKTGFTADGSILANTPMRDAGGMVSNGYTFSWDAVTDASSYAFVIFNAREDWRGRAYVMPATTTTWKMPLDVNSNGSGIIPAGTIKVHDLFGFTETKPDGTRPGVGFTVNGEEFNWTVLAMGTKTVTDFEQGRVNNPFDDIVASSSLKRYQNPGALAIMNVEVLDGSNTALIFNEIFDGYDAGSANQVTISVSTPNLETGNCCASIDVNGVISNHYPINFDSSGNALITVDLGQGYNWINVYDGVNEFTSFNVQTTGGIPPVIQISNVMASTNTGGQVTYTPDQWNYFDTSDNGGAKSVSFTISVTNPDITSVNVNLGSDVGAYNHYSIPVTSSNPANVTLDVYTGNNWIGLDTYFCVDPNDGTTCQSAYINLGVYSNEGSVYVPPIGNVVVTEAVQTDDWGGGSYWDASNDADNKAIVSGILASPNDVVNYNISSDGNWENGTLKVNPDGSFTLPVTLYNGDNWVNFYHQDGQQNGGQDYWYDVNIYTANGNVVIRPAIESINQVVYDGSGMVQVNTCSATINGLAIADGEVNINWSGDDGTGNYNYENYNLIAGVDDNADGLGAFSFTVPVISGVNAYNSININDANYIGIYLNITTSALNCVYVPPELTVDSISIDSVATDLIDDGYDYVGVDLGNGYPDTIPAGQAANIIINGTSSKADALIKIDVNNCGNHSYTVQSSGLVGNLADWSASIDLYDGYSSINISDGFNFSYMNVYSQNGVMPTPQFMVIASGTETYSGCGYASYDVGSLSTVTLSGTSKEPDGTATYWDALGEMGTFEIVNGQFSFTVDVYDGYNYISMNDVNYNYFGMDLYSINGNPKPKRFAITSPMHSASVDTSFGPVTITVTAASTDLQAFNPDSFYAYVEYSDATGNYVTSNYSSDQFSGDLPIIINQDGSVSFNTVFDALDMNQPIYISVSANDVSGQSHGQTIYLNNLYGYGDYSYKPGSQSLKLSPKQIATQQRAARYFMKKLRNQ